MTMEEALEQVQTAHDLIDEGKITVPVELTFYGIHWSDVDQLGRQEGFRVDLNDNTFEYWAQWHPHPKLDITFFKSRNK